MPSLIRSSSSSKGKEEGFAATHRLIIVVLSPSRIRSGWWRRERTSGDLERTAGVAGCLEVEGSAGGRALLSPCSGCVEVEASERRRGRRALRLHNYSVTAMVQVNREVSLSWLVLLRRIIPWTFFRLRRRLYAAGRVLGPWISSSTSLRN